MIVDFPSFMIEQSQMKSISIIGLKKNVGKTTTLNRIISILWDRIKIGLTSIGRDGEPYDIITNKPKPKIYIKTGTIISTAHSCLNKCDITKEVLETTDISTPLGEIVIIRALSDGKVELAGPSTTKEIKNLKSKMYEYGCDLILVDGAFSRKSFASPSITNSTIIATGAAVSDDMQQTIQETIFTYKLLSLSQINDEKIRKLATKVSKLGIINHQFEIQEIKVPTILDCTNELIPQLSSNSQFIVFKGLVTDKIIKDLMKRNENFCDLGIIVEDGTKLFLSQRIFDQFVKSGGELYVINPINILCFTANPWSPDGFHYPKDEFLHELRKHLPIPVYNVLAGG